MYTKAELRRAARAITAVAKENNVTEERVRADMLEAIESGRNNPDPRAQAQWADFEFIGQLPTPEEFIAWMTRKLKKSQQEISKNHVPL